MSVISTSAEQVLLQGKYDATHFEADFTNGDDNRKVKELPPCSLRYRIVSASHCCLHDTQSHDICRTLHDQHFKHTP